MRLIASETIFVDHCHDTAESIKTIVHESVGYHHIRDGLMWFKNSRYSRLKIEPNEDADITVFSAAYTVLRAANPLTVLCRYAWRRARYFCTRRSVDLSQREECLPSR